MEGGGGQVEGGVGHTQTIGLHTSSVFVTHNLAHICMHMNVCVYIHNYNTHLKCTYVHVY